MNFRLFMCFLFDIGRKRGVFKIGLGFRLGFKVRVGLVFFMNIYFNFLFKVE